MEITTQVQSVQRPGTLPVDTKFTLGESLTPEQIQFFHEYGFIHFKSAFSSEEVQEIVSALQNTERHLIDNKIDNINGVPVIFGEDEKGDTIAQRIPFSHLHCEKLNQFARSNRIQSLTQLIEGSRVGIDERDGVVANHYVATENSNYKSLGWHTDALRDVFYLEKVRPMLNVGIHISPSSPEKGGLVVLPKTHEQGILGILFRKIHFADHRPDKNELFVQTEIGDVTVHDGRMWHRATTPTQLQNGHRRSIYFPILCGPKKLKDEKSKAPFYLKLKSNKKIQ